MKKLLLLIGMVLVLSSFTFASSEWQTSTYASQVGLQIIYPKLDFYKIIDHNLTFNFNVLDENNTHLENDTTQCIILIYNNNGSRIVNTTLLWDDINFYYNWNTINFTTPQNLYYTVFCNYVIGQQIISKGFTSNNFRLNINGDNDTVNISGYIALIIMIFGVIFVLFFVAERIEFGYFIDSKGQPIQFFRYLVWIISGWILLIPIQTAIKLIEVYNYFDTSLYEVIYTSVIYIMLFLTTIWLVGFLYKILESMDMFNMKE